MSGSSSSDACAASMEHFAAGRVELALRQCLADLREIADSACPHAEPR